MLNLKAIANCVATDNSFHQLDKWLIVLPSSHLDILFLSYMCFNCIKKLVTISAGVDVWVTCSNIEAQMLVVLLVAVHTVSGRE